MTEVEEFILENQAAICAALALVVPDHDRAAVIYERAEIIRAQIANWKLGASSKRRALW